jgi:putative flippase GtrA
MSANDSTTTAETLLAPQALAGQLARFAIVGATNTALSWGLFALMTSMGVWYPAASGLAFAAGAVNGYTLNRVWTFRAGAFRMGGLARYAVVQAIGLAANVLTVVAFVEVAGVHRLVAQVFALGFVSLLTFGLNRRWAFGVSS